MLSSCLPDPFPESAAELERYLLQQRSPALAALGLPDELVLPCYDLSIANLPSTLTVLLGGWLVGAALPLPDALWGDLATGVRRVVWVILDAVGWLRFHRLLKQEGELSFARLAQVGWIIGSGSARCWGCTAGSLPGKCWCRCCWRGWIEPDRIHANLHLA